MNTFLHSRVATCRIIYFTGANAGMETTRALEGRLRYTNENPTELVKGLFVKLFDMLDSSNFVRLSTVKVLRYTVIESHNYALRN